MVGQIYFERKVGPKGQVVIPKEIRKMLDIKPQSKVYIGVEEDRIVIKPKTKNAIEEFLNLFPKEKRRPLKIEDIDRWYEEELEEKWERIEHGVSRR